MAEDRNRYLLVMQSVIVRSDSFVTHVKELESVCRCKHQLQHCTHIQVPLQRKDGERFLRKRRRGDVDAAAERRVDECAL